MKNKITIIGAGSFGISLASSLARAGNEITIIGRNLSVINQINNHHKVSFFNEINLPSSIIAMDKFDFINESNFIFICVPTTFIREVCTKINPKMAAIVTCSKGIEFDSLKLPSQIIEEFFPNNEIIALSGPNFASEIINHLPAITSISSKSKEALGKLANCFIGSNIRPYPNTDIIATQLAGALKNVIAIACGICLGKKQGENAKASIITRGINEIGNLIENLGYNRNILLEPAGIGDISLTCNNLISRNMKFGYMIGSGENFESYLEDNLVEGVFTVKSIIKIANQVKIELPISQSVYDIIYNHKNIDNAITDLMEREIVI